MMERLANIGAMRAEALRGMGNALRRGIVESYNPALGAVQCSIQPEGIMTGWCPVLSQWAGNGWGLICPPPIGAAVLLAPEDGDGRNLVVIGTYYSEVDAPPDAADGEAWLVHATGAFIKLTSAGIVSSGTWNHTGNLEVTGEVYRGYGGSDQVSLGGHTHNQPADSAGDTEAATDAPNAGT